MSKLLVHSVAGRLRVVVVLLALATVSLFGGVTATSASASAGTSELDTGEMLISGQQLHDDVGTYRLVMQGDGNLVEYQGSVVEWASRTAGHPGAHLIVQGDGNVVLYSVQQKALWSTRTAGAGSVVALVMQDDGNVVLYRPGRAIWKTGLPMLQVAPPRQFLAPSTLTAGQSAQGSADTLAAPSNRFTLDLNGGLLQIEEHAFVADPNPNLREHVMAIWAPPLVNYSSVNGTLVMQRDGNLVMYNGAGRASWSTRTSGSGNHATLQDDGNLVIYSAAGHALWASGSKRAMMTPGDVLAVGTSLASRDQMDQQLTMLSMQTDGNLVLYHAGKPQWSTRTFAAGSHLALQADGNLVVYAPNGRAMWSSHTANAGPAVVLEVIGSELTLDKGMGYVFLADSHSAQRG
ncbi:D-mannose binding lectin [Jatrophihabitans sp. GAS493]|uniref:bulb-type lectin domain-containing protein n=1 Tax=Jatrophihabitans sp. GAS493 TaxID=1907575 RepID=UPI000BB69D73|nr:bulb-type lectin domain-containing protein [Jatrophihabitans sp. GAS493]SOD70392.1 D-mannose binding lectin [Jatrophihabitans sp. GAS493]